LSLIATHEVGHSLGIGTVWDYKNLLRGAGSSNPTFSGSNARAQWRALGGTGNVPVENTGGAGTRDGHWREATFGNELMTGFLDTGKNPLSRLTIASLKDLGYVVNLNAADVYTRP
jgi:Leishmanolysin